MKTAIPFAVYYIDGLTSTCGARVWLAGTLITVALNTSMVLAQPTFSIDYQGPTMLFGVNAFVPVTPGIPIFEGDILSAPFPGPPMGVPTPGPFVVDPGVVLRGMPGPFPVVAPINLGIVGGPFPELDALSYGVEPLIVMGDLAAGTVYLSVDEFAIGLPFPVAGPSVFSEGAGGFMEASADIFANAFVLPAGGTPAIPPALPMPASPPAGNIQVFDGDGVDSATGAPVLGLALDEPNPPSPGIDLDTGDNLDAVDIDTTLANLAGPVYFSLDSIFADPLEAGPAVPPNTGTAAANGPPPGFVGGDVLVVIPGPAPAIALYAPAALLGLGLIDIDGDGLPDPDSDDLDALVLSESGDGIFTPSVAPYDWVIPDSITDMLLFSVRRGSAIIGMADSIFGAPIEEGDILTTPVLGGFDIFGVLGGPGPVGPGIFVPAEYLGLATVRSGMAFPFGDDLDALDIAAPVAPPDCNSNSVPDAMDIDPTDPDGDGFISADCNSNETPDECDIAAGAPDCDSNGVLDACQPDCNSNGLPDACDIDLADPDGNGQISPDCNSNGAPDECEVPPIGPAANDCNANGTPDMCESVAWGGDCNSNGAYDICDIYAGTSADCDNSNIPDDCELAAGISQDCNSNAIPDRCDFVSGFSTDCDHNGVPDSCELAMGFSADCNSNGVPDQCDLNQLAFAPVLTYTTGYASLISFAVGDLDSDADRDLVAIASDPSLGNQRIIAIFNSGTATFESSASYPLVDDILFRTALADLEGDGDLDLAVTTHPYAGSGGAVSVLLNDGTGAFGAPVSYSAGMLAYAIVAVDIDGNGDRDLVVTNYYSAMVSVLLNAGTATFAAPVSFAVGVEPFNLTFADLDSDGDQDLAVANASSNSGPPYVVSILENTSISGTVSFAPAVSIEVGPAPWALAAADLDDDGDADLAVARTGEASILLNTSSGATLSFAAPVAYPEAAAVPQSIAAGHLDGDNDVDLVIANSYGGVSVLRNNGNGTFAPEVRLETMACLESMGIDDLDGDGNNDIAFSSYSCGLPNTDPGTVAILLNLSSAISADCNINGIPDECDIASGFSSDDDDNGIPDECELILGNVNGDGRTDGADIQGFGDCLLSGSAAGPCAAADIDGDGDVDDGDLALFIALLLVS